MGAKLTRLGKVVGSVKTDPGGWTYWQENDWRTNEPGWVTMSPSGARMTWYPNEEDAKERVRKENEEWFA